MLLLQCSQCLRFLRQYQGFVGQDGSDLRCPGCEMRRALSTHADAERMVQRAFCQDPRKGYDICYCDGCREPVYRWGYCLACWEWLQSEDGDDASVLDHAEQTRERQDAEAMDRAGWGNHATPSQVRHELVPDSVRLLLLWMPFGFLLGCVLCQIAIWRGWMP